MKKYIFILLSIFLCALTACDSKGNIDPNNSLNSNEDIDYVEDTNNKNTITEEKLSDIWYSNKTPTTFDELKPFLLDGCWVYINENNQLYTQIDIIAFSDFPVMVENEYFQFGNNNFLFANVISNDFINDTAYERHEKYKNVEMNYPTLPIKSDEKFFDKYYYYYNFTFENNQSVDDGNINICFTRYYDTEWYLTMDDFNFEKREITFKGEMKYKHYSGDIANGPWEEVTDIEDNECTFKHFTSIEDAEEYIFKEYIEPLKP